MIIWLYLSLSSTFNYTIEIPLSLKLSDEQAIGSNVTDTVKISMNGSGWDLLGVVMKRDIQYYVDVSNVRRDSRIVMMQQVNERTGIPVSVRIFSVDPDTIYISFGEVATKYVPIINNVIVEPRAGYDIIGRPILSPDSIKITGPASEIRKVNSVKTEVKTIRDVNGNITITAKLQSDLGASVKLDQTEISISYVLELSAEKTFDEISIVVENVPPDKEVLLIPPNLSVSFRGGVEELSEINITDIYAFINFDEIYLDTLGYVVPQIDVPQNIQILDFVPDKFQYIIKNK